MPKKKRSEELKIRVTAEEKRIFEKGAERAGFATTSAWLRFIALRSAKTKT